MTRFIHDQLAKGILEATLSLGGIAKVNAKVTAEIQEIDVLFTPATGAPPPVLGLLGELAPQVTTLFEPFRKAVTLSQVHSCQNKLNAWIAKEERNAKREDRSLPFAQFPFLWILTPTASKRLLENFNAQPKADNWPPGVDEFPPGQRTGIVAIHQLPKRPDTLWLRLLGRDRVQQDAMEELQQLASDDPLRQRVLELTYDFLAMLEARQRQQDEEIDPEDEVLFMQLSGLYQQRITEERRQGEEEGWQRGEEAGWRKGQQDERRQTIENILSLRFGEIDSQLQSVIEPLMTLTSNESLALLMELSKDELIERFNPPHTPN